MMRDPLRIALGIIALAAIASYAFVFRPLETELADRYAQIDGIRNALERNQAIGRRIPRLERERLLLAATLRRYRLGDARATIVDRFLHATSRIATDNAIAVQTVTVQSALAPSGAAPHAAAADALDQLRLDITMRGPYANVIRAIRALNDAGIALDVSVAALGTTDRRAGTRPQLTAAFHVTLIREADAVVSFAPRAV